MAISCAVKNDFDYWLQRFFRYDLAHDAQAFTLQTDQRACRVDSDSFDECLNQPRVKLSCRSTRIVCAMLL